MFTAWNIACGVHFYGCVSYNTYRHLSKFGITLKALGTFPLRYVEKIRPIYPNTLRTSGLSIDLEFTSFNFSYNFFSQDYSPMFPSFKPKRFNMFISYWFADVLKFYSGATSSMFSYSACWFCLLFNDTFVFLLWIFAFLLPYTTFLIWDTLLYAFYFFVNALTLPFVWEAFLLFFTNAMNLNEKYQQSRKIIKF